MNTRIRCIIFANLLSKDIIYQKTYVKKMDRNYQEEA